MINRKGCANKSPSGGSMAHKEGRMETKEETREQSIQKIQHYLPTLTDAELRLAAAFIRGIKKNQG